LLSLLYLELLQFQQETIFSIVGSSTVYPFATLVAEKMGIEGMKAPRNLNQLVLGGRKQIFLGQVLEFELQDFTNFFKNTKR
jgi:hypothetical protein